jgi:alanyl-tRNA synthetase
LHAALREVLGSHVKQAGSMVAPERLRFDFSHHEPVAGADLVRIESIANLAVISDAPVRHYETTKAHAESIGAIAFFGDKYGDVVKVLEAGPHSIELCGGTHVHALGDIGPVKIISEASIGSNIRRIEAVSGMGPIERLRNDEERIRAATDALGVSTDELVDAVERRVAEVKELRARVRDLERAAAAGRSGELVDAAVDGIVVARVDGLDRDAVRDLAVAIRDHASIRAVVLGTAPEGGGVTIVAAVTPDSGLNASELIADAAKAVKGGGGKSADLAVAGGKDPAALDHALELARSAAGIA